MKIMAKKAMSFEASIARLEEILHTLENGGESLETTLQLYEEGISLIRASATLLEKAEQSVKILQMGESGSVMLQDFGQTEESNDN